ncbi:MAG: AAA family ATPase [Bacteroidales bacterium]|nr:AAA family ATPase [Bacteroidales bacterium]
MDKILYIEDYQHLFTGKKNISTICPFCNDSRGTRDAKSFSINTENGAYQCFHCGAKGYLKSRYDEGQRNVVVGQNKGYVVPKPIGQERVGVYSKGLLDYFASRGISETTLKIAKITQEKMYSGKRQKEVACIGFNFFDKQELVNVKKRTRDKEFQLVTGAKNIPYNINSLSEEQYLSGEQRYGIITEGEMDALTYIECGLNHVVSVPNGANSNLGWLDDYIESHFDPLEVIYVSSDSDKKGVELRDELLRRFGKDRCRVVEYPKPCKDINEVLMQYGKDAVKQCFDNAVEYKPDGVNELLDVEQELDYLFLNGFQKGCTIGIESFDEIISFKTGLLTIVTGVPSHGKTYFLNFLLIRLNIIHNWKIAYFSPEFYPVHEHVAQVVETIGGKRFGSRNYSVDEYKRLKLYIEDNFFWIDPDDTDINSVMERAKYFIRKRGIKALVIDPFNALTDNERKNQKQDEYISDFLQKLRWFARKYDLMVFLVMHPTKLQRMGNGLYPVCDLYNCKGASEIYDKADVGITVWRNEKDDYVEVHLTKVKFRHLGSKGKASFKFNVKNGRYVAIPSSEQIRLDGSIPNVVFDESNYLDNMENGNGIDNVPQDGFYSQQIQPNDGFYSQPQQEYFAPTETQDEPPF